MFKKDNVEEITNQMKKMKVVMTEVKTAFNGKSEWLKVERKAVVELTSEVKKFTGEAKKMSFSEGLNVAGNLTAIFGRAVNAAQLVVGAVVDIGKELYNLSLAGAEFNTVRDGFHNLSGSIEKAEKDLAIFRKAASFNLDDKALMSYANKMYALGFSSEQTAQMLDIVEESGDKVGLTFSQANDSLNAFLTSGNTNTLGQLKIPVGEVENEVQKLTGSLGKNKDQLSELEKEQINTTALLNVYGRSMGDISTKQLEGSDNILLMKTSIENLQSGFQSFIADALSPIIEIGSEFVAEYQKMIAEIFGGKDAVDNLKQGFIDLTKNAFQYWLDQWRANYKPALIELLTTIKRIIDENPELLEGIQKFGEFMISAATKISSFFISALNDVINKIDAVKEMVESVKDFGEKVISIGGIVGGMSGRAEDDDPIIDYANEIKAVNEIRRLKAELKFGYGGEGINELRKRTELIEVDRLEAKESIQKEDISEKSKKEKLDLTDKFFAKKKEETTVEFYKENLNHAVSSAQQIASTLGIGAHTFVGTLLNGLSSAMSLASSVASLISSVANLASGGGFFSVIGKIFGFAEGGRVPGSGSGDTVPAMLTPGEFVIKKSIVDKMGSSFFAWINGGLLPSMAGHYAMGGMVSAAPSPIVNNSFDVHIDRRGDVHVVQKALQKLKSNRTYFGG